MKQCEHGHFYDETRFAACPYCRDDAAGAGGSEGTAGKTVAAFGAAARRLRMKEKPWESFRRKSVSTLP